MLPRCAFEALQHGGRLQVGGQGDQADLVHPLCARPLPGLEQQPPSKKMTMTESETYQRMDEDQKAIFNIKLRLWDVGEMATGDRGVRQNFSITSRFLEFHSGACFCYKCGAPVPLCFAHASQREEGSTDLFKPFRPDEGPASEGRSQYKVYLKEYKELQAILRHDKMPEVKTKEFLLMRFEFEEHQRFLSGELQKKATERKTTLDYSVVNMLEDAKNAIDVLKSNSVKEIQFLKYSHASLQERSLHHKFLTSLEKAVSPTLVNAEKKYHETVCDRIMSLQEVVATSDEGATPQIFTLKAQRGDMRLKFQKVAEARRRDKNSAGNTFEEDGVVVYHSATFSVVLLRAKKVIARISDFSHKDYRNIMFTFNEFEGGDWCVNVEHHTYWTKHLLFSFDITAKDLESMRKAGKTMKLSFNDDLIVINAFNLLQLLARILST
eukprot:NODE_3731_length_1994_cov_8.845742.p1 GENE.NODE_3731_length_1994_cov_8.845742~~NODE_3731_length_1994_cov_8.845742.p1  ORF type:complete len:438 (-),score=141.14 NODE_3731_length_1994_cov_8.845742:278-1591(-)